MLEKMLISAGLGLLGSVCGSFITVVILKERLNNLIETVKSHKTEIKEIKKAVGEMGSIGTTLKTTSGNLKE